MATPTLAIRCFPSCADHQQVDLNELRSINETLESIRTDASEGGAKANRLNVILQGGAWVLGGIAILVAILIATRVIR